ncbi:MAG: hypothetical protein FJ278_07740, partial [Planctomycetes bacterium]|nr:hypothetical protein [Planctomycetota bacterium]
MTPGCGKSKHERDLEAKLAEAETARAELTKKLTAKQQELDRVVQATTERQDALRKELEESRNK